jgi:hypothetical protein
MRAESTDGRLVAARFSSKPLTGARELSHGRRPRALIGRHISVVDERGVVVFKVAL